MTRCPASNPRLDRLAAVGAVVGRRLGDGIPDAREFQLTRMAVSLKHCMLTIISYSSAPDQEPEAGAHQYVP